MSFQFREFLKAHPVLLGPLVAVYGRRYKQLGCSLRLGPDGNLVLIKGRAAIRLSISDNAFLQEAAAGFEHFSEMLKSKQSDGLSVTDYAAPEASGLLKEAAATRHNDCHKYGCTLRLGSDGKSFVLRKKRRELWMSIAQRSYISDAAQRLDYYIDAIEPKLVDGVEIGDFRAPGMHKVRRVGEQFKFTSFPESSEIADSYLKIFQAKLGDVIIDAGAYCGLTAYLFSKAVGATGRVVAVEADPRNYECLASNLVRLQTRNIDVLHAAVWRSKGLVEFASEGNMGSAVLEVSPTKPNKVSVQALTFSNICDELNLARVDHVKVDIEGAEYEALPASSAFINRYRPDFLVEMHLENDRPVNVPKLQNFFAGLDYQMRFVPQPGDEIFPLLHFWPSKSGG